MGLFEQLNIEYEVQLHSNHNEDQPKQLLSLEEINDGYKTNFIIEQRSYVEIRFTIDEKDFDYIHTRGDIIELYKDDSKKLEIHVNSKEIVNIESTVNSFTVILFGDKIHTEITFRNRDFLNSRLKSPSELESVFQSNQDIRYHFVQAKEAQHANHLVVVFSAFSKEYVYNYNYIDTLKDIPINKLFILDDFGAKGSYYLGRNKDFSIENSVISLILNICAKYNIPMKNIISMGSSKGGYSALYFGAKYSFGHIITLAPSLYLGTFLKRFHPDMLDYILGNNLDADETYLNNTIYKLFNNRNGFKGNIKIMVGTKDSRKDSHIKPFISYLDKIDYPYDFDLVDGVDHSQLKYFAPEYFKVQLSKVLDIPQVPEMYLTDIDFKIDNNKAKIKVDSIGENLEYAFYWYCDNIVIKKVLYSNNDCSELPIEKAGAYRVRVFLRNTSKEIVTKTSHTINI